MTRHKEQAYLEWLVIRGQQGDSGAFNTLVRHWQPRLAAYALTRLGDRDAAQDVSQEAWLTISRKLHSLKDPAAFAGWSFRITERRCHDWFRRSYRQREAPWQEQEVPWQDGGVTDPVGHGSAEATLDVARVLKMLDPRLAIVLRLYYLEELAVSEIAGVLDIPAGTVKSRLYYARKFVNDILTETDNE